MSKSMLIVDTPKCCRECFLIMQDDETGLWWCRRGFVLRDLTEIPAVCPLQPYRDPLEISAEGLTEMVRGWDRGE